MSETIRHKGPPSPTSGPGKAHGQSRSTTSDLPRLQRFWTSEYHFGLTAIFGNDPVGAYLGPAYFSRPPNAIIVPDHHGEVLGRIRLVEIDECRLALAAGGGMDAGDLAANRGGFSDVAISLHGGDTLAAK